MISVYDKDIKVLKSILLMVVIVSATFVSYIFFQYVIGNSYAINSEYSLNIVYNDGRSNCKIENALPNENFSYNFSVIGYNNTEKEFSYELFAQAGDVLDGLRYEDGDVLLTIKNKEKSLVFGPLEPLGLTKFGISLGKVEIAPYTSNFVHEYTLDILYKDNFESMNNLVYDESLDKYYSVDVIIKKMD